MRSTRVSIPFVVASVAIVGLGVAVALTITLLPAHPPAFALGGGAGYAGVLPIPETALAAAMDAATAAAQKLSEAGRNWKLASTIFGWTSFACSAAITLLAGLRGHLEDKAVAGAAGEMVKQDQTAASTARGTASKAELAEAARRRLRLVGLLAAAASVGTAAAAKADDSARERYARSDEVLAAAANARKDVFAAKTAEEADRILADLKAKVIQLSR